MTLKEFRETSRMRAYSDHARKYGLLIEASSMIALLDYVDALEYATRLVALECHLNGKPTTDALVAKAALAKGEVEI